MKQGWYRDARGKFTFVAGAVWDGDGNPRLCVAQITGHKPPHAELRYLAAGFVRTWKKNLKPCLRPIELARGDDVTQTAIDAETRALAAFEANRIPRA